MGSRAADTADPFFNRIIDGRHMIDRAGLSLAIGDQHLAHMHLLEHFVHYLNRAGCTGHNAGTQAAEIEVPKLRVIQFGDKHRRDTVQGGATLLRDRRQGHAGVKGLTGEYRGAAVGDTGEVSHHHAEAVVQRHGDTQPVVFGQVHAVTHTLAVIEDIPVSQRGAFRIARGTAGKLDIDRISRGELRGNPRQALSLLITGQFEHPRKIEHARTRLISHPDHQAKVRQFRCPQPSRFGLRQFRRQVPQHTQIVTAPEFLGGDKDLALHLVECIFQFVQPIGRVDTHHDRADFGGGVLGQAPLVAVGSPDADPVAGCDVEGQQAAGKSIDLALEFAVGPANTLVAHNQGVPVRKPRGRSVKGLPDSFFQQRLCGGTGRLAMG